MSWLRAHLRNKFLAGALAATPVAVLAWAVVWLETNTQPLTKPLGIHFPGLGMLIAVAAVYLLGVLVTSLLGRWLMVLGDHILRRVPGLSPLYQAWKDVLVLPPGKAGVYSRVVLIPALDGRGTQLGFTSGEPLPGDPKAWSVFVPSVPNPLAGQLVLVDRDACLPLDVSVQDAFKFLLSNGNYAPAALRGLEPAAAQDRR
jgi:uncharacterized membrane protein